jgi:hypothetical protein
MSVPEQENLSKPLHPKSIMKKFMGYFKKEKWGKTSVLFTLIFLFSSLCHAGSVNDVIGSIDRVKSSEFPIRFAVLGDTRDGDKIYIQLIGKILARKPHFVIHLGDMIPKPGDKAWPHFFAITNRFDCPFSRPREITMWGKGSRGMRSTASSLSSPAEGRIMLFG